MTTTSNQQKGFVLSREVTLGNLLTVGTLVFAIIASYYNTDKRVSLIEHVIAEHESTLKTTVNNQATLLRSYDKIVYMIEEAQRQNSWGKTLK